MSGVLIFRPGLALHTQMKHQRYKRQPKPQLQVWLTVTVDLVSMNALLQRVLICVYTHINRRNSTTWMPLLGWLPWCIVSRRRQWTEALAWRNGAMCHFQAARQGIRSSASGSNCDSAPLRKLQIV